MEHGISSAKRKFSSKFGMKISSSTVHGIKVAYKREKTQKQRESKDEDSEIEVLPVKGRGTPKLLGEKLDEIVKKYVLSLHERGGAVNSVIVLAGARGIVKCLERTRLREYGGHVEFTTSWAKSLLK